MKIIAPTLVREIKSGLFNLSGKKAVRDNKEEIETVVDVAEPKIERPKKNKNATTVVDRNITQTILDESN